jgi:adenine-specific DNA-methyltransferase
MGETFPAFTAIERVLGRPYCQGPGYLIYQADCLEAMTALPAELVDLTITSPPYNIGKEYEKPLPLEQYLAWCGKWMAQIHRLTRPKGAFWLNLGYVPVDGKGKAVPLPYLLWNASSFFLIQEVVWNYGAGVAARKVLSPRNEKFLWYAKDAVDYTFNLDEIRDPDVKYPAQKKNGKLRCNIIGKNPSDVWQIAKVTSGEDRSSSERAPHPAQFPLDLITRIVKGFSNPGDLVLDPFMGSGSTAEACVWHSRPVLGFEINPDYCRYIAKRLKRVSEDRAELLFGV